MLLKTCRTLHPKVPWRQAAAQGSPESAAGLVLAEGTSTRMTRNRRQGVAGSCSSPSCCDSPHGGGGVHGFSESTWESAGGPVAGGFTHSFLSLRCEFYGL